jgi:hypothetical protein
MFKTRKLSPQKVQSAASQWDPQKPSCNYLALSARQTAFTGVLIWQVCRLEFQKNVSTIYFLAQGSPFLRFLFNCFLRRTNEKFY